MMSVLEYAEDVNKSVSEILKKCGELGIDATNEEYMLNEEEITELDNTINTEIDEEEIEEIAEDVAVKEKIDIDNSRIIEPVEAIITGFALSVDSVSVCLGYGASGKNSVVLPILVTLFQIIFLYGGIIMSKKIRLKTRVNCITLISGLIIMIIGLYKLVPFFS